MQEEAPAKEGQSQPIPQLKDAKAGMALLETTFGIPRLNAAYLAGNIQQESTWVSDRPYWDDVGAPAGGLVSWRAGRIKRIEKYMGKTMQQSTPLEQLQAMMWEMETYYPSAYAVFMDTKANRPMLRQAAKAYWGWGDEGDRFDYAESLARS